MIYKMDFLRFLNDAAEKTSQTEKAVFPGAEKNGWEWLFTLSSKKKNRYITLHPWEKEKTSKTMNNMAMHCDNKNSSSKNI